ncbi:MAG: restriction endonuclease subunit S [Lachnoanaerobaculum sp.]|uniref:restriction endonuclease subunit S n=1 Tax=Lachnoanaerobaculum sp. TaxID=2049030 RepID=UPI0025BF0400|nr:restriction endonuclease subunit S [Lachnoanaerobaculum sp.]MBS5882178.1 restriction endonuclease subunit S [Lachnoanaerobaculum sp.]
MSRVPRIRFKGFEEDWEQRKLGEMVEFYNGDRSSRYPNDSDMVFDGIPFINAGDLVLGRVKLDTTNKITEEKYNQLSGAKIQCGDIIYCLRGTLGKNAFVDNFDIGTIASSLVDIRPQKIVGKYLFQVLNSDIEYSQRILNDEGAAQPNLSAKNLYLFDIPIPRDAEQIKIAEYLELLDHLITLHQRKLEKFKIIKKSMLENLFPQNGEKTPKIRFSGFTEDWEQRKLGEIGSVAMCRRVFKYQTTESGDIPFFKIGSFGATPDAFIPKDLFEKLKMKYPYPEKGDVLISASGSIGRTVVFTGKDEYFQDSNIVWLKHDNSIINHFLKYLYSIVKWVGIEGTTIKRLYNDNILKTEVIIPTLSEQQKVSNYLDGLDHLITLHQSKLDKLQKIKKSMLESMFV